MTIKVQVLPEPELEFGNKALGVEPRLVMKQAGPFAIEGQRTDVIELGLVCLRDEAQAVRSWFQSMHGLLLGEEANAERFREFPGLGKALQCRFEIPGRFTRLIEPGAYQLQAARRPQDRFEGMLELFGSNIESLFGDLRPRVIIVALPEDEAELRIANPKLDPRERAALEKLQIQDETQMQLFAPDPEELRRIAELKPQAEELLFRNFYRALKARVMQPKNAVPIQVVREHTYREDKAQQSAATRAWNLGVSIYYKAGNVPWKPKALPTNFCFVGVSFHHLKRRGGDVVYASVAQAFSNSVHPFVLKGASIPRDQVRHRQPYLQKDQARDLLERIVRAYEMQAGLRPDRVVIHKTSRYQEEEEEGFRSIASLVPAIDLIWISQTGFRLVKRGTEEVWRGTLVDVDDREHYLFTTGYVPWWKEYPGPHIPSPIQFGSAGPTDLRARAIELLALTKMNWNSSDGLGRFPVTLSFARRVGMVMTELAEDPDPNPSYRFYM